MTQYPPPPPPPPPPGYGGYYPPPPPGYGYPPPGYYQPMPQPPQAPVAPPQPKQPPEPLKSKSARIWDVLTILFEIGLLLALLVYLLGRISTNEDRSWLNRVENARDLRNAAVTAEAARLDSAAGVPSREALGDAGVTTPAEFNLALNAILDDQLALQDPKDAAAKKSLAALVESLPTVGTGTHSVNSFCDAVLPQLHDPTHPLKAVPGSALLALEAPILERLTALGAEAPPGLADWEAASNQPVGMYALRQRALANLLVLLQLRRVEEEQADLSLVDRGGAATDAATTTALTNLTVYYLHAALPAEATGQAGTAPSAEKICALFLRGLNHTVTARGGAKAAGEIAAECARAERALPTPAQVMDRLAAWLIEDHFALWQKGKDTSLAEGQSFQRWTGSNGIEIGYDNLLLLCSNLHAIDEKPVTAVVDIANADGTAGAMLVSDYVKRLSDAATAKPGTRPGPDGELHMGRFDAAANAWQLVRELRILQAELHLMQLNADLIARCQAKADLAPALHPSAIDPQTGRPYQFEAGEEDWTIYSDFGAMDFSAKPNEHHDKDLDMQATRHQGLVLP